MRLIFTYMAAVLMLFSIPPTSHAANEGGGGAVVLSTTLLTIGERERTASISVTNRTNEAQSYRVSIIDMVMNETGQVTRCDAETPSLHNSASKWIIATPSSIHLAPGKGQKIRLLIRRPKDLEAGEYRAHLLVSQQPPADIAGGLQEASKDNGLQINIVTVYSTSVPIIVPHGETNSTASVQKTQIINDGKSLEITVNREGNASFRGFFRVKSNDAPPQYLPLTIYPESDQVTVTYELNSLIDVNKPITLSLFKGVIPDEDVEVATAPLTTMTLNM